jgi:hypothetical protein
MEEPRLVTQEEGEGSTPFGRSCAALLRAVCGGKAAEGQLVDDQGRRTSMAAAVDKLEAQRQALVDLEASILEAQKKVLDPGWFKSSVRPVMDRIRSFQLPLLL